MIDDRQISSHPGHNSALGMRLAVAEHRARLTALINSALVVETLINGTRIDKQHLKALMANGSISGGGRWRRPAAGLGLHRAERRARLCSMVAVDPVRQGKELGRKMMKAAVKRFRRHHYRVRPHRQHGLILGAL